MATMLLRIFIIILFLFSNLLSAQEEAFNCFSILVGKDASADGAVYLAHNEDDWGDRVVNWYKVPAKDKAISRDSIVLTRGAKLESIEKTHSYLWLELPELEFSDSYMNEFGLTITSNACKSREDKPKLTEGGIGYWLRRLMIERAVTAKEAVEIGGALIEKYGYASSGRTYSIADSYETWMLSVVNGKHWVAQRVADNHVAIIPNYYTIQEVDLSNSSFFLGSQDLIDYAIERAWYNPEVDGEFNFRKAYSDQNNLQSKSNKARHWVSLNALSSEQYDIDDDFPFSFKPKDKVSLGALFKLLRNHYENTYLDTTQGYETGNPHHQKTMTVCSNTNQYGFVSQLRNWLSVEIGSVLWIAPRRPCNQTFIPVYSGILSVPHGFASTDYQTALTKHFDGVYDYPHVPLHNHKVFGDKVKFIDDNYRKRIIKTRPGIVKLEDKLLRKQEKFEKKMQALLLEDSFAATRKLTEYTNSAMRKLLSLAKED